MPFDLKNSSSNDSNKRTLRSDEINGHQEQEDYSEEETGVGRITHQWEAPEFEVYEKSTRWYLIFAVFIALLVAYALFTNGPIMAITFILAGIVGYIHLQKDPRVISFAITTKGVVADKEMYTYENIHSFWIFYDPNHTKTISLHTKASMLPFIHIPINEEDPVKLRELLMLNIPEIKQDPSLIDVIERVLHI